MRKARAVDTRNQCSRPASLVLFRMSLCAYCGIAPATTRDHALQKGLFGKNPRPGDLLTVPSCLPCNRSFEKDDEYFKHHLALRLDGETHPRADAVVNEMLRARQRSEGAALTAFVNGTLRLRVDGTANESRAAVELGQVPAGDRIGRTVARIARGLWHNERGRPLPVGYSVEGVMWDQLTTDEKDKYFAEFSGASIRTVADGRCTYLWRFASDDTNASIWLVDLFGVAAYLAVIGLPPESSRPTNDRSLPD